MQHNYLYVATFFLGVVLVGFLIFPGQFDMVTMYRNSYLYNRALDLLDKLETQRPMNARVDLERAYVLYLAGRYGEAVVLLERLTSREPGNTMAWRRLAAAYRVMQRPRDVMAAYEHLVETAPADSEALYLLDEYYRWLQMPGKALRNLQTLTRHYPKDRYNWEKLFDLYMRTEQIDGAIETLDGIVSRFADNMEERLELGRLYLIKKDARAIDVFEHMYREFPDRGDIVEDLITALAATGREDRAVETFKNHYRGRLPPDAYYDRLAEMYVSLNRPAEAARALEERLETSPSEDTRYSAALLYMDAEQYRMALSHMQMLLNDNPGEQDYWKTYVSLLQSLEMKVELAEALARYTQQWPGDWEMMRELADAYNWNEAYDREVAVLERLIGKYPDREAYRRRLGEGYYALKHHDRAAEHLVYLLRMRPENRAYRDLFQAVIQDMAPGPDALGYARELHAVAPAGDVASAVLLADLCARQKLFEDTDRIYADLVRHHPGDAVLRARIGQLNWYQSRPKKAQGHFEAALEMAPDNAEALQGMADVLSGDRPLEALGYLERLSAVDPERPETAYRMAEIHDALGDTARAVPFYRRFLERAPGSSRADSYFLRQRAHALFRTGSVQQAMSLLSEGQTQYPEDLQIVNDYAEILIHQKRYDQAMALLNRLERSGESSEP